MRLVFSLIAAFIITAPAFAAGETEYQGILGLIEQAIHWLENLVFMEIPLGSASIGWIVVWMAAPMLILTVYFGFINLTSFKRAYKVLRGRYADPEAPGEVTQFQALTTALSGTVGLGNIGGVAIAIGMGGPGATFWMIVIGFFAMSLKYAECTLGVKYRQINEDGSVSGGPMYYLERGLAARGLGSLGKALAFTYAGIALIATVPQMSQVNQAFNQVTATTGYAGLEAALVFGILLAILTGIVIIGGIRSIASVTSRLVPLMAAVYIGAALFVIFGNIGDVPAAVSTIVSSAFSADAVNGGIVGAIVAGMRRAVYSTEAGLGTATMAHAAAKTREPVSEGMVALMEPFIDTVVICTMTALVIVITGAYMPNFVPGVELSDIKMTSAAFESQFAFFPWVLLVAVLMFAFSTIISWAYYAGKVWEFIFGRSDLSTLIFKITFCLFLIPGGIWTAQTVLALIDSLYFLMAVPNIIGIYLMAGELRRDTQDYIRRLENGEVQETQRETMA